MPSRATRIVVSLSTLAVFLGASIAQAAPGEPGGPFDTPPGQVISGKLSIVHGDNFEAPDRGHSDASIPDHVLPDMSYWLRTDTGEEVLLEFAGHPPAATPGGYYEVRGQRHERSFQVSEMKEQAAKGGGGGGGNGGGGKPKPSAPSYVGPRDMIVIPFTFAGNTTPLTATIEEIRERGFVGPRSVRTYYEESSATVNPGMTFKGKNDGTEADKDGLAGDVTQTFQINGATDKCDYYNWATAARKAAEAAGWDLTGYEHIVHLHPRLTKMEGTKEVPICSWRGLAQVGGTYSWLNGTIALGTWAHELGHNLTLYHSRTLICPQSEDDFFSVASRCGYEEYGDPFDVMGTSTNQRQYHARNKGHLGWFPLTNIASPASGQTYTLYPIGSATTGLQVLQIPRGRDYLYVDYRRPTGSFDTYGAADDAVNGVMIRTGPAFAANGNSYLIDTAIYPTTTDTFTGAIEPDFSDAALNPGEGFVDPASGTYIETISVNGDGTVTVLVLKGVSNTIPDISPTWNATPLLPGLPHKVTDAEATDPNKNLGRYEWKLTSCPGTCPELSGAEGGLSGGSDTVPGPSYVPADAGDYQIELTVWDALGGWRKIILTEKVALP